MSNEVNAALTNGKRWVLFCRGATEESIAHQAAELEEHANAHGFEVIRRIRHLGEVPVDLAGDRAMEVLTGLAEPAGVDALLITDGSRLTRRGAESAIWLKSKLTQAGITLIVLRSRITSPAS